MLLGGEEMLQPDLCAAPRARLRRCDVLRRCVRRPRGGGRPGGASSGARPQRVRTQAVGGLLRHVPRRRIALPA